VVHVSKNESAPKESALDANIGPIRRFGRYTLIKKLATGGMAEIWLARQSGVAGFNRFVVIKKILSHLAEEETFRNMFLDEARMSAALTHPNIVQVYDLGEADETYFIAMEFILGENLAAIAWRGVKRQSPLSPVFAARIMADACKALDYAHRLKGSNGVPLEIVHRDISPQNILVTYEGEVKVVDFGIAKAASKSQHTKTGMLKGKFSYMSPEQCLGHNVDRRSDVFALGIVLYELCTGKRLFKHESELMILEMITKRRITPPSEVASNIPAELERIIMKALEKDVDVRFATAQDFQIELEDFIRGQTEPAASGDIATYMRSLFQDKIEEKRRLQELASRDDFGGNATFADDEATERARPQHLARLQTGQRAQPVVSYPPNMQATGQIHVNGVVRQGTHPAASMPGVPMGMGGFSGHNGMPHPMQPGMGRMVTGQMQHPQLSGVVQGMPFAQSGTMQGQYSHPGMGGMVDERPNWVPRIIIFVALLVILVAGAYLYHELVRTPNVPAYTPPTPAAPAKVGQLAVDSVPTGAVISVNEANVKLEDGSPARTPISQLTNLQYGTSYRIKLEKEGYETWSETIVMGPETDNRPLRPTLTAIPGRIVAEVTGPEARDVVVLFNDAKVGMGTVTMRMPPGTLRVTAELPKHDCRAEPAEVAVPPGGSTRTTIRCVPRGAGGGSAATPSRAPGDVGGDRPRPSPRLPDPAPTARPPSGPADCQLLGDDVPTGWATIDTTPFSEIYWNGKRLGETPISKQKFPSGCIELIAKSATPPMEKKVRIRIEPNKNLRYRFDLNGNTQ
jgi:serine/threonine protein kinase